MKIEIKKELEKQRLTIMRAAKVYPRLCAQLENRYWVTKEGVVFSVLDSNKNIRMLPVRRKLRKTANGYLSFIATLSTGQKHVLVHRLIASEFLDLDLRSDMLVHHKNQIRDDNRVENLEVVTLSKNNAHSKSRMVSKTKALRTLSKIKLGKLPTRKVVWE